MVWKANRENGKSRNQKRIIMTKPKHCDHECVCRDFRRRSRLDLPCEGGIIETCEHDTRARGPVQQAPAITPPKDMTNIRCIDEGLKGLSDYFNAALEGDESKAALRRMWDQQMGVLFVLLKNCSHDEQQIAALIAQAVAEDRKRPRPPCEECHWQDRLEQEIAQAKQEWERERREQANPWCYPCCMLVYKAKAQERAEVLDSLIARIEQELQVAKRSNGNPASAYLATLAWCRGLKAGGKL